MQKILLLALTLTSISAFADEYSSLFKDYQKSLGGGKEVAKDAPATKNVKAGTIFTNNKSKSCIELGEQVQTSFPLNTLTEYLMGNSPISAHHNPSSGELTIDGPDMVGNCAAMLDWSVKAKEINGKQVYALEVGFKKNNCEFKKDPAGKETSEQICEYKYVIAENGNYKSTEKDKFSPDMSGFHACLEKSGVVKNKKSNPAAIYAAPIKQSFSGLDKDGDLMFLSHGPKSYPEKSKYESFLAIDGCDHYEILDPETKVVVSAETHNASEANKEFERYQKCERYDEISEFLGKNKINDKLEQQLIQTRDALIIQAAKASAARIAAGKYTADDLEVMSDFNKYIVKKYKDIVENEFDNWDRAEGKDKTAAAEKLALAKQALADLNKSPFFTQTHIQRLIADGKFDEAKSTADLRINVEVYSKMGNKVANVVMTPEVADVQIKKLNLQFAKTANELQEKYEVSHGQTTGVAIEHQRDAETFTKRLAANNQLANAKLREMYQDMQSYCSMPFRNQASCLQEREAQIKAVAEAFAKRGEALNKAATESANKAKEYAALEQQGRRYIAAQNGEEAPSDDSDPVLKALMEKKVDAPTEYNGYAGIVGPITNQPVPQVGYNQPGFNFQMPQFNAQAQIGVGQNPMYGFQQQQQPFLGSQAYQGNMGVNFGAMMGQNIMGMNNGYNNGYGQQAMYPQQQNMMYPQFGQQPMYGQYNMYGQQGMNPLFR